MSRVFSGVQPTGNLHLGNYLGAIKNFVKLQNQYECIYCIVDMHAVTVKQDPSILKNNIIEVASTFIASGIDPEKSIIFAQSHVPSHAELAWIFNCVSRLGWLNRMTQFKEKAGKNRERASVGLYTYPVLMAADILAYHATHVPVGDDQRQHLELARDIANKFNSDFGINFFPIIEPIIMGSATRVMSLRDGRKKMSKSEESDYSRLNLTDSRDEIINKIKKAKTDPLALPGSDCLAEKNIFNEKIVLDRPEAVNLLNIFSALSEKPLETIINNYAEKQFSVFKNDLGELAVSVLSPVNEEIKKLKNDHSFIEKVLNDGAKKAKYIAEPIVEETKKIIGYL